MNFRTSLRVTLSSLARSGVAPELPWMVATSSGSKKNGSSTGYSVEVPAFWILAPKRIFPNLGKRRLSISQLFL